MQAGIELRFQQVGDCPVARQPRHAGEFSGNDPHPHMGFAGAGDIRLVAGMQMAFVDDAYAFGREGFDKFFFDAGSQGHHPVLLVREKGTYQASNIPVCQFLLSLRDSPIISAVMRLDSKYFDRIRTRRKREQETEQAPPTCQWDGCDKKGAHRAPVGRNAEGQFFLFCFEHVKEYNKGYNYFSGLSDGEIARYQKEAITGHRPTWTVGVNKAAKDSPLHSEVRSGAYTRVRDPFGFVKEGGKGSGPRFPQARKLKSLETKAFETMGLDANATSAEIKSRYKELVKKHHPDANGGDRGSEERFRAVIQAYQLLKQNGFC
ncbi:DnaJ domain family protein [Rhizobium leguminosarum]|uniref:DnaJ domain family protein n=4 Tax=Rhizobium TaxID=379 RepID=A0A2Z4YFM3_RHILE|nr:dnaJ domain protein [Rhizobium leguminosarum bv. viciae]AXA40187.1 DnaJ domain family protein [Rhizobium leguminosarum]